MATNCDLLHCVGERTATLRYRPPGHALHEGHRLYGVCAEHRDQLVTEPGYVEVTWRDGRYVEVATR